MHSGELSRYYEFGYSVRTPSGPRTHMVGPYCSTHSRGADALVAMSSLELPKKNLKEGPGRYRTGVRYRRERIWTILTSATSPAPSSRSGAFSSIQRMKDMEAVGYQRENVRTTRRGGMRRRVEDAFTSPPRSRRYKQVRRRQKKPGYSRVGPARVQTQEGA